MATKGYSITDIVGATGAERHLVRYWCRELPPLCGELGRARTKRWLDRTDVLFLITVKTLTASFGMRVEALSGFSAALHKLLKMPHGQLREQVLFLAPGLAEVRLVSSEQAAPAGLWLPMEGIVQSLLVYLDMESPSAPIRSNVIPIAKKSRVTKGSGRG